MTAASLIGGRTVVVNAVNENAGASWRRYGFMPSKDDPLTLFRSVADVAASFEG